MDLPRLPRVSRRMYGNLFLDSLSGTDQEALRPLLSACELTRGQILIEQESLVRTVHFPITARLANQVVQPDGESAETALVGREGLTGLAPFMADVPSTWQVSVRGGGSALAISATALRTLAGERRDLMQRLLVLTHFYQAQASQTAACNALHKVVPRLSRWLLMSHDQAPDQPVQLTQEELGRLMGSQRTTINEAAARLRDAGAIAYARGDIRILDLPALERAACSCYAAHRRWLRELKFDPGPG